MSHGSGPRRAVLIAGPTASGKSALALRLARELDGTVINADAMQVYRDLRVITARPSPEEERDAPHRLYGHVDAAVRYSVGGWLADVQPVLAETWRAGRVPIVVGGTGLYFKALTRGLAAVPPIPPAIREDVLARLARDGPEALHAELMRRDPEAGARLKPADRTRIARALEVVAATGRPLSQWHAEGMPALLDHADAVQAFLDLDRAALYARIDARFEAMLAAGALDEVRELAARGLDPLLPAMKAHGVPWLIRHLRGEITLAEAADEARQDTRRYAKRQFTWFRHQMPGWIWTTPDAACDALLSAWRERTARRT